MRQLVSARALDAHSPVLRMGVVEFSGFPTPISHLYWGTKTARTSAAPRWRPNRNRHLDAGAVTRACAPSGYRAKKRADPVATIGTPHGDQKRPYLRERSQRAKDSGVVDGTS